MLGIRCLKNSACESDCGARLLGVELVRGDSRMTAANTETANTASFLLLADYDSNEDGPLFAVSDEGSAAAAVVDAAYSSAKAAFSPSYANNPLRLGVILDGERMTSAGE